MRLLLISVFTIILVAFGLITLRQYGLSQTSQAFEHPLLEQMRGLQFVSVSGGADRSSLEWILAEQSKSAKWIALDLHLTSDKKFFVFPESSTGEFCDKDLIIARTPLADLTQLNCQRSYTHLSDILTKMPEQNFWLSIRDNLFQIHKTYESVISKFEAGPRVITHSDFAVVTSSIRKLQPGWIYASGQPDEVRLIALHSMYLETLWTPKTDIVTLKYRYGKKAQVDRRMVDELHRQKKKVFLVADKADQKEAEELAVDGIIFQDSKAM